jgi:hypothetical protein
MKRNKITTYTLFVFFVFFLVQCNKAKEDLTPYTTKDGLIIRPGNCLPDVKDKYVYRAFSQEEQANIKTHDDFVNAGQIPENVLKEMSTLGLIRSLLDMPWLNSTYMLSSSTSPILKCAIILDHYNIPKELFQRKDAFDALLLFYNAISVDCYGSINDVERLNFGSKYMTINVLLSRSEIISKQGHGEKQKAVAALLGNYMKNTSLGLSGGIVEAMTHIMLEDNYPPVLEYRGEYESDYFVGQEQIDALVAIAKKYIR